MRPFAKVIALERIDLPIPIERRRERAGILRRRHHLMVVSVSVIQLLWIDVFPNQRGYRSGMSTTIESGPSDNRAFQSRRARWVITACIALAVTVVLVVGREQLRLPSNIKDETVVARLGTAGSPYPPELRAAALRARERPADPTAAVKAAHQYLDYGRAAGDARFAGAALGVLEPWLNKPDPEVLNLAADARQYGHDFEGAVVLLDAATKVNPRDAQALLTRANIRVVQGRFRDAEADCLNLARARRADLAILCDTTSKALLAEGPGAYTQLERTVAVKAMDDALMGYAHSLLAEMARFLAAPDQAEPHFIIARKASPADLRTMMIYADFLLAQGRPKEALEQLAGAPQTDSILVRQAEAHMALGEAADVERIVSQLGGRFEEQSRMGETAHAREAARFWLNIANRPSQALEAAQANWTNQRELEDAILLLRSARAAGRPEAAQPVLDWAKAEHVVAPMFLVAVRETRASP
jgi:tetratricopeptide (TPR) repeat protein